MYLGASFPEYWQKASQKDDGCQNKVVLHTTRVGEGCQKVDTPDTIFPTNTIFLILWE